MSQRENKPLAFPVDGKPSKTNREKRKCSCCCMYFDGPGYRFHTMEMNDTMRREGYCPNVQGYKEALALSRNSRV